MDFLPEDISAYTDKHCSPESEVLAELNRKTWSNVLRPRMLSGHVQGRVLAMLSKMIQPKYILEIGTYTGYSAICLAEGLAEGGQLISLDVNEELETMSRDYINKAGFKDKITLQIGDALNIIPTLKQHFDLVFIDADKENYIRYYQLLISQLKSGAYIIADNVLWSGKVTENYDQLDPETKTIVDFNKMVQEDDRVENVLLAIRDGLMVLRVK